MSLARPSTDKEYEARWDAETLANAERIKADPGRLDLAQAAAKAIVDQKDEDQKTMRKVAGKKSKGSAPATQGFQNPKPAPKQAGTKGSNVSGYNIFQRI